jgi:hypothetical protein
MVEENGHKWFFLHNEIDDRCVHCQIKYSYYLAIKKASEEQPKRQDLKEWLKCKRV